MLWYYTIKKALEKLTRPEHFLIARDKLSGKGTGKKEFSVATVEQWWSYIMMYDLIKTPPKLCYYESLIEDRPCCFYVDYEYMSQQNPFYKVDMHHVLLLELCTFLKRIFDAFSEGMDSEKSADSNGIEYTPKLEGAMGQDPWDFAKSYGSKSKDILLDAGKIFPRRKELFRDFQIICCRSRMHHNQNKKISLHYVIRHRHYCFASNVICGAVARRFELYMLQKYGPPEKNPFWALNKGHTKLNPKHSPEYDPVEDKIKTFDMEPREEGDNQSVYEYDYLNERGYGTLWEFVMDIAVYTKYRMWRTEGSTKLKSNPPRPLLPIRMAERYDNQTEKLRSKITARAAKSSSQNEDYQLSLIDKKKQKAKLSTLTLNADAMADTLWTQRSNYHFCHFMLSMTLYTGPKIMVVYCTEPDDSVPVSSSTLLKYIYLLFPERYSKGYSLNKERAQENRHIKKLEAQASGDGSQSKLKSNKHDPLNSMADFATGLTTEKLIAPKSFDSFGISDTEAITTAMTEQKRPNKISLEPAARKRVTEAIRSIIKEMPILIPYYMSKAGWSYVSGGVQTCWFRWSHSKHVSKFMPPHISIPTSCKHCALMACYQKHQQKPQKRSKKHSKPPPRDIRTHQSNHITLSFFYTEKTLVQGCFSEHCKAGVPESAYQRRKDANHPGTIKFINPCAKYGEAPDSKIATSYKSYNQALYILEASYPEWFSTVTYRQNLPGNTDHRQPTDAIADGVMTNIRSAPIEFDCSSDSSDDSADKQEAVDPTDTPSDKGKEALRASDGASSPSSDDATDTVDRTANVLTSLKLFDVEETFNSYIPITRYDQSIINEINRMKLAEQPEQRNLAYEARVEEAFNEYSSMQNNGHNDKYTNSAISRRSNPPSSRSRKSRFCTF